MTPEAATLLEELCASEPATNYSPLESVPPTGAGYNPQASIDLQDI